MMWDAARVAFLLVPAGPTDAVSRQKLLYRIYFSMYHIVCITCDLSGWQRKGDVHMLSVIVGKSRAAAFALVACVGLVSGASAATLDFVIDRTNSSVTVNSLGIGQPCSLSNCGITAVLADSLQDGDTYTIGTGDSATFDFLTFSGTGRGLAVYSVNAVLSFLSPTGVTGSGSGTGGMVMFAGFITQGSLNWSSATLSGALPGGSVVDFDLQGLSMASGAKITTTATLKGVNIVPLPAGAVLLISALGGLAALRQRTRARAA
jgi:hypothetical protein